MTSAIRVVVADDHNMFRQGLIEMLNTVTDIEVVGDGATADAAIDIVTEMTPDVAILDVGMPGPGPTETLRRIREISPSTQVVIVTMFDEPSTITELIRAGAAAYLLKSSDRVELATAVRMAARGDEMVYVSVTRQALLGLTRAAPPPGDASLSARELNVLEMLATAKRNHDIGTALHISDATVKRHLTNIYTKLGATSRTDAVRAARRLGLVHD